MKMKMKREFPEGNFLCATALPIVGFFHITLPMPSRILLLLIFLRALTFAPLCTAANKPNIVFILCDDLGYGDVRCLNPEGKIATPNMDRLAAEGMAFTDAHTSSAVCSPTRYGAITGRYNWSSRLQSG